MRKTLVIALALVSLSSWGCVPQSASPEADNLPSEVRSIAVLPPLAVMDSGAKAPSPKAAKELQDGAAALASTLAVYFSANPKVHLVSDDQLAAAASSLTANRLQQAMAAARALGAEAVMLTNLSRYQERQGGDYGVQAPASVAFEYRLLLTENGQTLCAGSFDETQQSTTENLLHLKTQASRGFKWISASDLLQEGVSKKLPACDYLKPAQKTGGPAPDPTPPVVDQAEAEPQPKAAAASPASPAPEAAPSSERQEVAASAPEPPAVPATPPPDAPAAPPAKKTGVLGFLEAWKQAWEKSAGATGDMGAYGALYAPDFTDRGQSREAFLADKGKKNGKKDWIKVNLKDIQVSPRTGDLQEARFTQDYASSNYSEISTKTLLLRQSGDGWQIVSER